MFFFFHILTTSTLISHHCDTALIFKSVIVNRFIAFSERKSVAKHPNPGCYSNSYLASLVTNATYIKLSNYISQTTSHYSLSDPLSPKDLLI